MSSVLAEASGIGWGQQQREEHVVGQQGRAAVGREGSRQPGFGDEVGNATGDDEHQQREGDRQASGEQFAEASMSLPTGTGSANPHEVRPECQQSQHHHDGQWNTRHHQNNLQRCHRDQANGTHPAQRDQQRVDASPQRGIAGTPSCSAHVAVLLGSGLAVGAGPAHVELVASAEPNEMATYDVLQARQIVRISLDGQMESVRRAAQLGASVRKLNPAALVAVGPLATITTTEMRDKLLSVARRSISDYQSLASTGHRPRLLVSLWALPPTRSSVSRAAIPGERVESLSETPARFPPHPNPCREPANQHNAFRTTY